MKQFNLLIKNRGGQQLKKVNESAQDNLNSKYKFEGVFTICSVPGHTVINRNQRIYPEKELLKHLGYLRERIKQDGSILGELDHPDGRFDISLKEASHKITDLWYDQNKHAVMGKLELLDTPNGKIAKALVDAGYPLFVSSRAAGDVDERTHEVEIANIFTYDIVCTPGFEEARLNRVNESYRKQAKLFLNESIGHADNINKTKSKYGIDDNTTSITEMSNALDENEIPVMKKYSLDELSSPLLNAGSSKAKYSLNELAWSINEDEDSNAVIGAEKSPEQITDEDAKVPGIEVKPLKPVYTDSKKQDECGDNSGVSNEYKEEKDINEDADKDEKRKLIIDIKPEEKVEEKPEEPKKSEEDIIDIKAENDGEKSEDVKEAAEKKCPDCGCPQSKCCCKDGKCSNCKDCHYHKTSDIEDRISKDEEDVEAFLKKVANKKEAKESIVTKYPFSISLSPSNFSKFSTMTESEKSIINDYIINNGIFDIQTINEKWEDGLNESKREAKAWLRLASEEDKALFLAEPIEVQDAIEESAKFFKLENANDVNEFWIRTGLRQKKAALMEQEKMVSEYKELFGTESYNTGLGYSSGLVKLIENAMLDE